MACVGVEGLPTVADACPAGEGAAPAWSPVAAGESAQSRCGAWRCLCGSTLALPLLVGFVGPSRGCCRLARTREPASKGHKSLDRWASAWDLRELGLPRVCIWGRGLPLVAVGVSRPECGWGRGGGRRRPGCGAAGARRMT